MLIMIEPADLKAPKMYYLDSTSHNGDPTNLSNMMELFNRAIMLYHIDANLPNKRSFKEYKDAIEWNVI